MDKIIGEFQKNSSEVVKVIVTEYHGHQVIDTRVYFPGKDGEYYPSKKGITLSVNAVDELIPLLRDAVAETQLKQDG